jgi:hypothetical protein
MAIAIPAEGSRQRPDPPVERDSMGRSVVSLPVGTIRILGDDPLLIRALDRLLRGAGYAVGTENRRNAEFGPGEPAQDGERVGLTIVDLPDHHALDAIEPVISGGERTTEARLLWIGSTPPAVPSDRFLVKPFTTDEFLSRVAFVLASQNGIETRLTSR